MGREGCTLLCLDAGLLGLFCVGEFLGDFLFVLAVGGALEPVVDEGERNVRFSKLR